MSIRWYRPGSRGNWKRNAWRHITVTHDRSSEHHRLGWSDFASALELEHLGSEIQSKQQIGLELLGRVSPSFAIEFDSVSTSLCLSRRGRSRYFSNRSAFCQYYQRANAANVKLQTYYYGRNHHMHNRLRNVAYCAALLLAGSTLYYLSRKTVTIDWQFLFSIMPYLVGYTTFKSSIMEISPPPYGCALNIRTFWRFVKGGMSIAAEACCL